MRRGIIFGDKKGVSVLVSYVLLITFVIIISVVVFQWMRTYIPRGELNCPSGTSVFVKSHSCIYGKQLNFTIVNNGNFNVGGYFIHATNDPEQEVATDNLAPLINETGALFQTGVKFGGEGTNTFMPSSEETEIYDISKYSNLIYSIEIIPLRWQTEKNRVRLVSCQDARIRETISCGAGNSSV